MTAPQLLVIEIDEADGRILGLVARWIGCSPDLVAQALLALHLRRIRTDARGQVAAVSGNVRPAVGELAAASVAAVKLQELLKQALALDCVERKGGADA